MLIKIPLIIFLVAGLRAGLKPLHASIIYLVPGLFFGLFYGLSFVLLASTAIVFAISFVYFWLLDYFEDTIFTWLVVFLVGFLFLLFLL